MTGGQTSFAATADGVVAVRSALQSERWLVVLDDVWSPVVLEPLIREFEATEGPSRR